MKLIVVMPSVAVLSIIILGVIMFSDVRLSVVAPTKRQLVT